MASGGGDSYSRSLDDYIDVAQRIADFRDKYPEGSLRPLPDAQGRYWQLVQAQGWEAPNKGGDLVNQSFIVVVAAAYRHPTDPAPGVGMAWEIFPGRTPYTRGSELQNAETSAWGRAIIAVGASDSKKGIASRDEVRNRQAEREPAWPCDRCQHDRELHIERAGDTGVYWAGRCRQPDCTCQGYVPLPVNRDGSLSRSQTTDEQKAAAGVMTDGEQRAHNQLAKPPANAGPAERLTAAPGEDLWATGPSGLAPETDPEDQHGTATADQITMMQIGFKEHGIGKGLKEPAARDAKIAWLVHRFGPDIHSSKDLSYNQAAKALQELT